MAFCWVTMPRIFRKCIPFNTTPTGSQGAIWSGGMAPAVDTNGNIYVMTGNGTFDGTANFGESLIKLNGSLSVQDYATPSNWSDPQQW